MFEKMKNTSGNYYIHQEMEIKILTLERHKYMAVLDWLMGSQSLFSNKTPTNNQQ
jgi:hypothetical protein